MPARDRLHRLDGVEHAHRVDTLDRCAGGLKVRYNRIGRDRPPPEAVCLQASDYYLWALQRMLERGEDRYFRYLSPAFRLIIDRDDSRRHGHGEFYTASSNPLTLERLMPVSLG